MTLKRVRLTFPETLIQEPIIYQIGLEFRVVRNIRMADVDECVGWVIRELRGDHEEIERAVEWIEAKGLGGDAGRGDEVEG